MPAALAAGESPAPDTVKLDDYPVNVLPGASNAVVLESEGLSDYAIHKHVFLLQG
jgi:hypothetical protein